MRIPKLDRLHIVLILTVIMLVCLSGGYASKAYTGRAVYICSGNALLELHRGQLLKVDRYLNAARVAYFTGSCDPVFGESIGVEVKPTSEMP